MAPFVRFAQKLLDAATQQRRVSVGRERNLRVRANSSDQFFQLVAGNLLASFVHAAPIFLQRVVLKKNPVNLIDLATRRRRHEQRGQRGVVPVKLSFDVRVAATPPNLWKEDSFFDADVTTATMSAMSVSPRTPAR